MAEQRRQTHSARVRRQTQQSEAQFWNNQPDPVLIERGQTQAVQLVRDMINPTSTMVDATGSNTTGASAVPPMVYIDEDGLEEQFLTEDEVSQEVLDVTANRVTTPVGDNDVSPLDPIYTQSLIRKWNWICNRPEDQIMKMFYELPISKQILASLLITTM